MTHGGTILRRRRHRRRSRRLHRRDPRRAARPRDGLHRRRDAARRQARAGRHLHQRRLHPVQGAAPVVGELRARGPRVRRSRHRRCRPRRSTSRRCSRARTRSSGRTTTASSTCSRRTRSPSSTAAARSRAGTASAGGSWSTVRAQGSLSARHVIVATGSSPRALPGTPFDNERVLDNAGALSIPEVPKRLGRRRRRRHRAGDGQRLAPPRRRGHDPRGACRHCCPPRTRRSRRRHGRSSPGRASRSISACRSALCGVGEDRVDVEYKDAAGAAQSAGVRPPDRVDRPRADDCRPERRRRRPEAR